MIVLTTAELKTTALTDPFRGIVEDANVKLYVTFLRDVPKKLPSLPAFSSKKDVKVFEARGLDVFSFNHKVEGSFGFPNSFVERLLQVRATNRNWNTVQKILKS